jgi:hypothetical protein
MDRLDQDLAAARASLVTHVPMEVAVKGTLGIATQARAAVSKSESKVAKLESQIAALVDLYETASTELESNRAKLVEAEAAMAKAAASGLPPEHYLSVVSADPIPFWSAFKSVILHRCPGLPTDTFQQLDVATKAFEAALNPLFVQAAAVPTGPQPAPSGAAAPPNPSGAGSAGAGLAAATENQILAPNGGITEPREVDMQEQAQAQALAAQQAADAAAAAATAAATAAIAQQQAAAAAAAAAAAPVAEDSPKPPVVPAMVPVDGGPGDNDVDNDLLAKHGSGGAAENDTMGLGEAAAASDGIVGKRPIAALATAKGVAARAKARVVSAAGQQTEVYI